MATRALTLARRLVWLCLAARFAPCSTAPLGPDARAPATPASRLLTIIYNKTTPNISESHSETGFYCILFTDPLYFAS